MIRRRRGRRARSGFSRRQKVVLRIYLIIGIIFFLVGSMLVTAERRLKPSFLEIAKMRARQVATEMLNRAINEKIAQSIRYQDLVRIERDSDKGIAIVEQNTGEISRLLTDVTLEVQNALNTLAEEPIQIPLGQVFGSELLAAMGPRITVRVVPVGTVELQIVDRVESVGINQTRHKIYVVVETTIKIVIPLLSSHVSVRTEVPLTDFSIVGEVPQFYMKLESINSTVQ
jgi:sporulation protein YunB